MAIRISSTGGSVDPAVLAGKLDASQLGAANGAAKLDSSGKIILGQLPLGTTLAVVPVVGAPTAADGINADYALDVNTGDLYGPKANNTWPTTPVRRGSSAWGAHGAQLAIGKTLPSTGVGAGTNLATGGLYASPLPINRRMTFDQIGVNVTAAGVGATLQLSIYTTNLDTMAPDQLVYDAGSSAVAATGAFSQSLGALVLQPGLYHVAAKHIAATTVAAVMYGNADLGRPIYGGASHGSGGSQCGWAITSGQVAGAMPASYPAGSVVLNGSAPLITLRRSA